VVEKVEGDKAHTHGYHTSDNTRALGLAAEEAQSDSVWTIRDGIIYRQDYTWTDETMAAMAKAQSAAEATELPKTGVAPAVSTLTWVLALAGVAIAAVVSLTLWRKKARR